MDKQQLRELAGKPWFEWKLEDWKLVADSLSELLEAAELLETERDAADAANSMMLKQSDRAEAAEAHRDRLAAALQKIVDSFYFLEDHIHQDCVICRPAYEHRHEEDCPILAAERLVAAEALKEAERG